MGGIRNVGSGITAPGSGITSHGNAIISFLWDQGSSYTIFVGSGTKKFGYKNYISDDINIPRYDPEL